MVVHTPTLNLFFGCAMILTSSISPEFFDCSLVVLVKREEAYRRRPGCCRLEFVGLKHQPKPI